MKKMKYFIFWKIPVDVCFLTRFTITFLHILNSVWQWNSAQLFILIFEQETLNVFQHIIWIKVVGKSSGLSKLPAHKVYDRIKTSAALLLASRFIFTLLAYIFNLCDFLIRCFELKNGSVLHRRCKLTIYTGKYITPLFPSIIAVLCIANVCKFYSGRVYTSNVKSRCNKWIHQVFWTICVHDDCKHERMGKNRLSIKKIKRLLRHLIMKIESGFIFRVNQCSVRLQL